MLAVKNLLCSRNDKTLFSKVEFSLLGGEILQITGKNGIGKTTLLRTIAGLMRPTTGQIAIDSTQLCYVGHKSGLHPDLTVLQNLQFLQICMPNAKEINPALEYFQILHKKNSRCGDLSAGQCQRVSLARLCITNAKIWLLDEPLANLDKQATVLLSALCIQHLTHRGIIIIATHSNLDVSPFTTSILQLESFG